MAAAILSPSPVQHLQDFRRRSSLGEPHVSSTLPRNRSLTCFEAHISSQSRRQRSLHYKPSLTKQSSESKLELPQLEEQETSWPRPSIKFEAGKLMLRSLDFNALQFSADDLMLFVLEIFNEIGVVQNLSIDEERLKKFIKAARSCMRKNHYHNWAHAFDVVQTTYAFALQSGTMDKLSMLQKFALVVAALCHDLEHPGVSNQFLIARRHELAVRYNDRSVLENHHAFRAFQLMNDETQLLADLSKDDYFAFRAVVISCVLSTDMAKHGDYVRQVKASLQDTEAAEDVLFECKLLIKCADISNVTKPFAVARLWARRITRELFEQGDRERADGMPVTATCDRERQSPSALQRGFAAFIAIPYFETVEEYMPKLRGLSDRIRANAEQWADIDDEF